MHMLKRLLFSGLILSVLLSSCGVYDYLERKTHQGAILSSVKKNGLLVRLRNEDVKIKSMRDYGKHIKADNLEAEITKYNNLLLEVMEKAYGFSAVYYYYSCDADAIFKEGDYSRVMNKDLQPANFQPEGELGVLLCERYELNLHKWDSKRMIPLDKMVYPKYKFRTVSFILRKPSIGEVMHIGIPIMNRDFEGLSG